MPDIGASGTEQCSLNGVKATAGIRPGVDLGVEFGNKARGEDFRSLPAGARRYPGLLRPFEVARCCAVAQIARASQGTPDTFDHVRPIIFRTVIERASVR